MKQFGFPKHSILTRHGLIGSFAMSKSVMFFKVKDSPFHSAAASQIANPRFQDYHYIAQLINWSQYECSSQ